MIKYLALSCLALFGSACTTVTTYDRNGHLTGSCRISGLSYKGGQCIGQANDGGVQRREVRAQPSRKAPQLTAYDDMDND